MKETVLKNKEKLVCTSAGGYTELRNEIQQLRAKNQKLQVWAQTSEQERRRLHNTVVDMRGNIRVVCRVRDDPMLKMDPMHLSDNLYTYPDAATSEEHITIKARERPALSKPQNAWQVTDEDKENTDAHDSGGNSKSGKKPLLKFKFDRVLRPSASQKNVFNVLHCQLTHFVFVLL